MSTPFVGLDALQRACVNVSAPLGGKGDSLTSAVVIKMIQQLRSEEESHALAKAVVWRVSEASVPGADRLGSWLLLDTVLDDIRGSIAYGEFASVLADSICKSLPDLIRVAFERWSLPPGSQGLEADYGRLESKWNGSLFSHRLREKISRAFAHAKKELVPVSTFRHLTVPSDLIRDSLWKLRREDPRPVLARRMRKLFPAAENGEEPYPIHIRLKKWFDRLSQGQGCSQCDTFFHEESSCPCRTPLPVLTPDQAIKTLMPLVTNPTTPSTIEVFDVVVRLMIGGKPFHPVLAAFDTVRGSKTAPLEQSALFVIASYSLVPSKLKFGSRYFILPDAVKHHFQKLGRYEELQHLNDCLHLLRTGFFAYDESEAPDEDFSRWIKDLRDERLMLFLYFDKTRMVDPPNVNGWDRRLRRLGCRCSLLCRRCLATEHCTLECALQADYDHRAATDAIVHHRLIDPATFDDRSRLDYSAVEKKADDIRERKPLEAHKLQMALALLFPGGPNGRHVPFCTTCRVFDHSISRCRQHLEVTLDRRREWPKHEMSVVLFVDEMTRRFGAHPADEELKALLSYGRSAGYPIRYGQALQALSVDDEVFPQPNPSCYFSPAMVRYQSTLVESLLKQSNRLQQLSHLDTFREKGFPEPCIYCGTCAHPTIRCGKCPEDVRITLRTLTSHDLTIFDLSHGERTRDRAATSFLVDLRQTTGFLLLMQQLASLERDCTERNRQYMMANGISAHCINGLRGTALTRTVLAVPNGGGAVDAEDLEEQDRRRAREDTTNGAAADLGDEDQPPHKALRLESDGIPNTNSIFSMV